MCNQNWNELDLEEPRADQHVQLLQALEVQQY